MVNWGCVVFVGCVIVWGGEDGVGSCGGDFGGGGVVGEHLVCIWFV